MKILKSIAFVFIFTACSIGDYKSFPGSSEEEKRYNEITSHFEDESFLISIHLIDEFKDKHTNSSEIEKLDFYM